MDDATLPRDSDVFIIAPLLQPWGTLTADLTIPSGTGGILKPPDLGMEDAGSQKFSGLSFPGRALDSGFVQAYTSRQQVSQEVCHVALRVTS